MLGVDVCEALGLLGVREGERGLDREGVLGVGRLLGVDLCEELGLLGGGGGGRESLSLGVQWTYLSFREYLEPVGLNIGDSLFFDGFCD